MTLGNHLIAVSMLWALVGCSDGADRDSGVAKPGAPTATDGLSPDAALVQGTVSATFPSGDAHQCQPLGVPLTAFLTQAFAPSEIAQEKATPATETTCLHEQELKAPADSWATLIYDVLCGGSGDAHVCGALTTRQCSIETMMRWAEPRTATVSARDPIFGFEYVVPPEDADARVALYRRARQEVQKLLDDAEVVAYERTAGTRACPSEGGQDASAAYAVYAEGLETEQKLDDILAASPVPGHSN